MSFNKWTPVLIVILVGLLLSHYSVGGAQSVENSLGGSAVGDVRLSLVAPDRFFAANNHAEVQWRVLNGDPKSLLPEFVRATGLTKFPDARGVFLRGMNLERVPNAGDPDGERAVGSYQTDAFQTHTHSLKFHSSNTTGSRPHPNFEYPTGKGNSTLTTTHIASGKHQTETRPRNIAVYMYVRVR